MEYLLNTTVLILDTTHSYGMGYHVERTDTTVSRFLNGNTAVSQAFKSYKRFTQYRLRTDRDARRRWRSEL
jgi:hypothetical protein